VGVTPVSMTIQTQEQQFVLQQFVQLVLHKDTDFMMQHRTNVCFFLTKVTQNLQNQILGLVLLL